MEFLTSNVFLQTIPLYIPTLHPIYHPTYGSFTVLENSHGSKILKKVITSDQLARMDNDLLERFQKLGSNNILQIKGVIREENGLYSAFYEYFEQTLKEEIEEKALEGVRYTSQQVLNVVQNISSALSGMQNNRFIHGEVKSSNIVRVGKDYKLLCPILFGKTLPIFTTEDPKSYVRNTTKIVSPEMLNAAHRDIIDPVHEDYKDDIYGLGLVALDMMTMRVEAPISVQKRLESSNLTYSNTLLRLIKKMLEDVLTLRLDPVACNQYIEKIYHQVGLESSKPPLNHNRNLSGIALTRKGATEDVPRVHLIGEQGRSHSISQQPSPVVSRTLTRTESCTPERKSLNFSYLLPEEIRRSPSYLVDDTSLHGKEAMKDRYAFPEVQRSDNTILQELELVKNYASGGSSRDEGFHNPQKDSSSCSMLSTNLTYNFAPLKKDGFETKSNIWDLSHMSPSTSETRLEFASMEDSAIVDRMWVAEKEVRSKPPRELMKRIVVPPVQVSREIRSGREKEKTENTPRFKEGSFGGKGSESQVDTSRRVYEDGMKRHEDSIRTMDSQRTQKYIGSPGPKTNEVQLKENVNSNYEMRSSSAPRNSTDTSNQGKRILRLNKKSLTPLVKKDGDTLTIRCYLNSDMETKCSESSMPEEKELLSNQLHREKVEDVPESISIYVHKPVIRQENRTRKQPLQTNTEVRRVVLGELKSQPNNLLERFSNSSFAENISETKESMIQSQVNFEQNTSIYSSNLFPKPSLMTMKSSYSQPNLRDSQLQKSRIVKEKSGDGSTYEGEMVGYLKHGRGKLTYSHGRYYEGEWQDGKISGFGTLYTDKADVIYQGLWQDGKYNGQGFENNLAPTEGHLLWEDQIRVPIKELGAWLKYQGQFADNAWNGFGEILLCNGDRYIGNFEDNKVNGRGRYIAKDGRIWEGEWQSNYLIATI